MDLSNFEVCRKINYRVFENNREYFFLSTYPYLDIVFNDHCNAECKYCISHLVHKKEWCNIETHKKKIEYAIKNLGVKEVLLLGGEPTINDAIFEIIDFLKQNFKLNKICITTNAHRMSKDHEYAAKLLSSGITHINISLMTLNKERQQYINGTNSYVSINDLMFFKELADYYGVMIRINNNCFLNNNDSLNEIIEFYDLVKNYCHSVKFSPLLKTEGFSTVNEVTEFNQTHTLKDTQYDNLWHEIENHYEDYPIIRNKETFGFVEYSMIMLDTPIILNYNQHNKAREKITKENKINSLKLLVTGDLSLSWNREEKEYFINTDNTSVF